MQTAHPRYTYLVKLSTYFWVGIIATILIGPLNTSLVGSGITTERSPSASPVHSNFSTPSFKSSPASQHQQHLRVIIFEIPTGGNLEDESDNSELFASDFSIEHIPIFSPTTRLNTSFRSTPLYRLFEVYRT